MGDWVVLWVVALLMSGQLEVTAEQQLNRARTCYGVLDFECAAATLVRVRASLAHLSPELQEEALRLSAEVELSRGRSAEAEPLLIQLLVLAPRFAPRTGAWPPPWQRALAQARARVPDRTPPTIELLPLPSSVAPGTPFLVRARITDNTGVDHAELLLPNGPVAMTATSGPTRSALVPPEQVREPSLGIVIRAADLYGRMTTTSTVFVAVTAPRSAPPSVADEGGPAWWVWALVGVAAVGGAVTVALVAGSGDDLGPVRARIEWP